MHNWTIVDHIYIYDATIEGLLTIVYKCIQDKELAKLITTENNHIPNLLDRPIYIKTDLEKAKDLLEEIEYQISPLTLYYLFTAFKSGRTDKEDIIARYLIYGFKYGSTINEMLHNEWVYEVQQLCQQVKCDAHKLIGFLRFNQIANDYLYAEYESEHDIIEYLAQHFKVRLPNETWIIHDRNREKISLYSKGDLAIVDASEFKIPTNYNDEYVGLWKQYFKDISIKERENRRCQKNFMARKYWKYMVELEGENEYAKKNIKRKRSTKRIS